MKGLSYSSAAYLLGYATGAFTFLFLLYVCDYFKCYEEIFIDFICGQDPAKEKLILFWKISRSYS